MKKFFNKVEKFLKKYFYKFLDSKFGMWLRKISYKMPGIFDIKLLKFFLVGILNTLVGTGLQFVFLNCFGLFLLGNTGTYIASGTSNGLASVMSYFLNKRFTFKNTEKGIKPALRFALNIIVCWLIANILAVEAVSYICQSAGLSAQIAGNISLGVASILFVCCNYIGQRFFAFKEKKQDK